MASEGKRVADDLRLVVFRLADELYGLNIVSVESIGVLAPITRVPGTPPYISGIINLRGRVTPVVDLRRRLGLAEAPYTDETRIVVVEHEDEQIGLLVDAVSEVRPAAAAEIDPPSALIADVGTQYIAGVIKAGDRLVIVLDLAQVLRREDRDRLKRERVS